MSKQKTPISLIAALRATGMTDKEIKAEIIKRLRLRSAADDKAMLERDVVEVKRTADGDVTEA